MSKKAIRASSGFDRRVWLLLFAMIADVTQPGRRSRAYGLVRVGSNTGWALGPIVAGTLLQARLPDVIWTIQLVAAALAVTGLVALATLRRRPSKVAEQRSS